MAQAWRRVAPWLTPILLLLEVLGLVTGQISVGQAVTIFLVVEALLLLVALINVATGVREYRAGRRSDVDRWSSAEAGLARIVPARAAHLLLIEAKIWWGFFGWILRRNPRGPNVFRYGREMRPIMWLALALLIFEGIVVDFVLFALLGNSVWLWASLAAHLYAVLWVLGFIGSLWMYPHKLTASGLVIHDAAFSRLDICTDSVDGARLIVGQSLRRSGFRFDAESRTALISYGVANVELELKPGSTILRDRQPRHGVDRIQVSVDDGAAFISALKARVKEDS